jgi:glutamine cyclotransferase
VLVAIVVVVAVAGLWFALRPSEEKNSSTTNASSPSSGAAVSAKSAAFEVIASYPHDATAYTQGLVWQDGGFYESTGLYGHSTLRRVEFPSGKVLKSINLAPDLFAEGLALCKGNLVQLTWTAGRGFVYEPNDFKLVREFNYSGEGWGLAWDGTDLIMSNGSPLLTYLNPDTYEVVRRLKVTMNGQPVQDLNELEVIEGEIWSNVWMTDLIVRIDPASGNVTSYLDLRGLFPEQQRRDRDDVLNGIAYDPAGKRIFVGGKRWPRLFEIKLK